MEESQGIGSFENSPAGSLSILDAAGRCGAIRSDARIDIPHYSNGAEMKSFVDPHSGVDPKRESHGSMKPPFDTVQQIDVGEMQSSAHFHRLFIAFQLIIFLSLFLSRGGVK